MLKLNKKILNQNKNIYTLFPKDKKELIKMIHDEIIERGNECSLNHIDVSNIKDMSCLFSSFYYNGVSNFNGDISEWDVSNVENMSSMFQNCDFDGDLSKWDVSNVEDMSYMFYDSKFSGENGSINNWNISNVSGMVGLFERSFFKSDISNWEISKFVLKSKFFLSKRFLFFIILKSINFSNPSQSISKCSKDKLP